MIEIEVLETSGESWTGPRSPAGNVILRGATYKDCLTGLNKLSFIGRQTPDATPGEILRRHIEWTGTSLDCMFSKPDDSISFEGKTCALFTTLENCGLVIITKDDDHGK